MTAIEPSELRRRMSRDDGAWPVRCWALFDVRDVGESQQGHIWSATFLPRHMIEFRILDLVSAPGTSILLYDSGRDGDRRAERALNTLRSLGYGNAECLEGGFAAWASAGYEIATGWNVPSKLFGEEVAHSGEISQLSVDDLAAKIDAGDRVCVLDVRTGGEYQNGSLPGSVSAPSFDWTLHAVDLEEGGNDIVLHCAGRTRSIIGAATARMLGLPRTWALENGTMGWTLSGRNVEKHQNRKLASASKNSRKVTAQRAQQAAEELGVRFLSAHELARLLAVRAEKPVYVFDVREATARDGGQIASSVWLPGGQACQRVDDFAPVAGASIVFIDDADSRAAITAYWFRRMGFPNVNVLDGGVPAWCAAGYPLKSKSKRFVPLGIVSAESVLRMVSGAWLNEAMHAGQPPLVIDVGTSADFASGHIAGAKWLPRGHLEDRIGDHAVVDTRIIVTAKRAEHATLAAARLVALGFRDVAGLALDWERWNEQLPVESGLPAGSDTPSDVLAIPYLESRGRMLEYLTWEKKLTRVSVGDFRKSVP